jgi:hypothetical protein
MNIAIFNSHTLLASHYETEIEIILNHQEKGDKIIQLVCNKELPACDINPFIEPEACERCVSKRKMGYSVINKNIEVKSFFNLTETDKKRISEIPKFFANVAELQKLKVDNFDVGYAISSSIISLFKDPNPQLNANLIERYIISSLGVYFSIINYLKENETDIVYVFNGRLAHTRAVLRACNLLGIKCLIHERGNSQNYYSIFENTSVHDLNNTQKLIKETWEKADPIEKITVAEKWYQTRIGGKMENWFSFLEDQIHTLPEGWDPNKINILICNSSEDEFASLDEEWKNPFYENQTEGIIRIVTNGANFSNVHFYLRIHPNLGKVDNENVRALHALAFKNLTVISASSKISTYHLVKNANKTITFGSTIGAEATFIGKPSILAGKSFYFDLNAAYVPKNHEDLMQLILQDLNPKPKENALMYSYFFGTFGFHFKYYKPDDFATGTIFGTRLSPKLGLKYSLIKLLYHNKIFPKFSEFLLLRNREKIANEYLPNK